MNAFLALDATSLASPPPNDKGDLELYDPVYLTLEELKQAVLEAKFKEVKWSMTVAMGLLWIESDRDASNTMLMAGW